MQLLGLIVLQASAGPGIANFLFLGGIVLVMYFFFMRPQMKKQKEQNSFLDNLKKGDEIVTSSGIIGRISKMDVKDITLQIDQKTFVKILPIAISKEMTDQYKAVTTSKEKTEEAAE